MKTETKRFMFAVAVGATQVSTCSECLFHSIPAPIAFTGSRRKMIQNKQEKVARPIVFQKRTANWGDSNRYQNRS
jgi:hypothetical protein